MCSATGGARRSRDVLSVQGLGVRQTSFVLPGPGAHTKGAPAGVTASAPRGVQLAPGAAAGPLVPDLGVSAEAMPRRIVLAPNSAMHRMRRRRSPDARVSGFNESAAVAAGWLISAGCLRKPSVAHLGRSAAGMSTSGLPPAIDVAGPRCHMYRLR